MKGLPAAKLGNELTTFAAVYARQVSKRVAISLVATEHKEADILRHFRFVQ